MSCKVYAKSNYLAWFLQKEDILHDPCKKIGISEDFFKQKTSLTIPAKIKNLARFYASNRYLSRLLQILDTLQDSYKKILPGKFLANRIYVARLLQILDYLSDFSNC